MPANKYGTRRSLALLLVAVAGLLAAGAARPATAQTIPLDAARGVGAAKVFRNLALYPVYDRSARDTGGYLTLDEGLRAKVVGVVEKGNGGEVNTLFVTNRARKPLYLMGGEVLLGGQQDRVLGQDAVVPAGGKNVPVTVFCVEHGRWNGRAEFGGSAKAVASAEIRAVAQSGAYAARVAAPAAPAATTANVVPGMPAQQQQRVGRTAASRPSPIGGAQQKVWDRVETKNSAFRAANATGTYRGVLEGSGGSTAASLTPYLKAFAGGLPAGSAGVRPVGVVVAINGRMVTADVFREPGLFAKLWPKLLRAYATDAAEQSAAASHPAPAPQTAVAFLKSARTGKADTIRENGVTLVRRAGKEAVSYRLMDHRAPRPAAKSAGAAVPLHENVVAGAEGVGP